MRTERLCCALGLALLATLAPRVGSAQIDVDAQTEVRAIRFQGAHSLSERRLRALIVTKDRGKAYGLRSFLGKIPFVPEPERHRFVPIDLQRDVVRLRRAYVTAGFVRAKIRYEVARDDARNLLDITFVVEEGDPVLVAGVTIVGPDSLAPLPVPESDRGSWRRIEGWAAGMRGRRLDITEALAGRDRITRWWQDRGFPRAGTTARLDRDSTRSEGTIRYRVFPDGPARFGAIRVEGNEGFSDRSVIRELPFRSGDRYSLADLEQARTDVQGLDIVRLALIDVPPLTPRDTSSVRVASATASPDSGADSPPASRDSTGVRPAATPAGADSVLDVRIRITQADPRYVSGEIGYVTDAGLSSEARWTHRNFTGEARTLTISALAQTGWLAVSDLPDIIYRGSVSLRQPYLFRRHLSGVLSPYIEQRDDVHDRSLGYGLNTTLVYQIRQLNSVSFDYQIGQRHVYEYRLEDLASGDIDLVTFLQQASKGLLDSLGTTLGTSVFTLSAGVGRLDNPPQPRKGIVLRPVLKLAAPEALTSSSYTRADAVAYAFAPLTRRSVLATRFALGRLFPYGKSLPGAGEDPHVKFLQLSDATFTAGGVGDVRGWENRLLGPKLPDVRFRGPGDTTVVADGYVPVGGFARFSMSVEVRLPLPALGPKFGSHVFLDGGRVWTDDERFGPHTDVLDQQKMFYAVGGGLDLYTPVGPIRAGMGYKLNPSIPDLVDSADLLAAQQQGTPYDAIPKHQSRRWQFYFAIGASF